MVCKLRGHDWPAPWFEAIPGVETTTTGDPYVPIIHRGIPRYCLRCGTEEMLDASFGMFLAPNPALIWPPDLASSTGTREWLEQTEARKSWLNELYSGDK